MDRKYKIFKIVGIFDVILVAYNTIAFGFSDWFVIALSVLSMFLVLLVLYKVAGSLFGAERSDKFVSVMPVIGSIGGVFEILVNVSMNLLPELAVHMGSRYPFLGFIVFIVFLWGSQKKSRHSNRSK